MKPKYLFFILFLHFILILFTQISFAEVKRALPANVFTPLSVGSGARALGMGGAFIAVADDATAASWNPGGLTQLERPEFSLVGTYLSTHQGIDTSNNTLFFDNETISRGDLNFASIAYPFRVFGKNMVAALGYQQAYDFHNNVEMTNVSKDLKFFINQKVDFKSEGGISALTPAIAIQVMPRLSIGVAVNFYTDEYFGDFAWKQKSIEKWNISLLNKTIIEQGTTVFERTFKNFQAINVVPGILWDVWEKEDKRLTFGAVYHTPYTANVDTVASDTTSDNPEKDQLKIDFPMSFGAGLGFRYSDALSFSMDVTWTDWSKFEQNTEETIGKTRPLGGVPTDRNINDTYAVKLGTEYLIFRQKMIIPVRGGLFYDPRPSLDDPADGYGFSVGSGITFKGFSIDGAYQCRWVNNINGEDFNTAYSDTKFDLKEHLFYASIIVYF